MSHAECPRCGAEVSGGSFCPRCGASLETRSCPSCGADSPPGDRFCTRCGAPLAGGAARHGRASASGEGGSGDGGLGWWVAGLLLVALILFLLIPVLQPDRGRQDGAPSSAARSPAGAPSGQGLGPAPNVDLSSMTPRQAADRLFDRVMRAAEQGDSTQVQSFLPMAIGAYERARPLDADGLFHLSVLQRTALEFETALETARQGLEESPNHLLLLSAAAEAARELGDTALAREHYSHLMEIWDEERSSGLEDYQVHSALLPRIREDAEAFLDRG